MQKVPSAENVSALAAYFVVSTDYLLGKSDIKNPPVTNDGEIDQGKRDLIEKIKTMDPDTVSALNALADTILGKRDSHTGDS